MMTSSNGNIFRATGPLCGEFTGPGEFPTQRPVTRSFDVFFDLRLNKRLSKQPWGWWFETLSLSLWRQCNDQVLTWTHDDQFYGAEMCCNASHALFIKRDWLNSFASREMWKYMWQGYFSNASCRILAVRIPLRWSLYQRFFGSGWG